MQPCLGPSWLYSQTATFFCFFDGEKVDKESSRTGPQQQVKRAIPRFVVWEFGGTLLTKDLCPDDGSLWAQSPFPLLQGFLWSLIHMESGDNVSEQLNVQLSPCSEPCLVQSMTKPLMGLNGQVQSVLLVVEFETELILSPEVQHPQPGLREEGNRFSAIKLPMAPESIMSAKYIEISSQLNHILMLNEIAISCFQMLIPR